MVNEKHQIEQAKAALRHLITTSSRRVTPAMAIKEVCETVGVAKKTVSQAIRALVGARELVYTYTHGCTFLEPSFEKPVRIGKRIILKPPNQAYSPVSDEVVINIASGAAFGNGMHPTTRLALEGIAWVFDLCRSKDRQRGPMLDIGTGSGILALAGVKMGATGAIATDIDPCARVEAMENVVLNGLEKKIQVREKIAGYQGKAAFALVTANLRMPTLIALRRFIKAHMTTPGALVVSGIKKDETSAMKLLYLECGFQWVWEKEEKDWAGLVFYS